MVQDADRVSGPGGGRAQWASVQTTTHADSVLAPLDPEEAAVAAREALAAVLVDGNTTQERTRVYDPRLRIEKPVRPGADPTRLVWVRIRDMDRHVVHEVSVRGGTVVEHVVDPDAFPPVSDAEREDAEQVLSAEPRLGGLLAEDDVEIQWFNPAHGPGRPLGARLVRVRDHEVVEHVTEAVVDLDDRSLVESVMTDE